LILLAGMPAGLTHGEEPTLEAQEQAETDRLIKAELPNWAFRAGLEKDRPLVMEPKSLLRWSNPGTGRVYGDVFVWKDNGRPAVVMSLFKAWEPANGFHVELHSLSGDELTGEREGQPVWNPRQPGIVFANVPDAGAPAEAPARRLTQMKAISREFAIVLKDRRVNDKGEEQSLRLLSQPLDRYESNDADRADGALFAFALGTDPEIFLLIEARNAKWQYGVARMNDGAMTISYKNQQVLSFERAGSRDAMRDPYVLTRVPEAK